MSERKLGFGTMRLPLLESDDPTSIDLEQFKKMADIFMERGFTYFDTAYPYHKEQSEEALREAVVRRFDRDRFTVADKMPVYKVKCSEDYETIFNEQLRRCGVEYFDYYLLHNLGRDRYPDTQKFGGFDFVMKKKAEGKIRKVGFSFHDTADVLEQILNDHPEVDFVQLQINYLDWDSLVAQSGKCYEVVKKHGKKVVVMEPVKGGTLAKLPEKAMEKFNAFYKDETVTPASLAIRFAASLDNVMMVLSGMSDLKQLENNTDYMQNFKPLSEEEYKLVEEITAILKSTTKVPCTSCRYCLEVCPMNINMPGYFGLLNLYAVTGNKTGMYYQRYSMNHGKASDCLKCGQCEANCPQHIRIRDLLEEFAALYETE
ncbi:MAG: aldo/keto reductase [Erysipelotrichaceae bacterium]|nr:aldo/keto reductase [Erysipelotrichaceae bacterium]